MHPLGYGFLRKNVKRLTIFGDLETRKYKPIKGGVTVDLMRVCSMCNVVRNTDVVFASHFEGVKHTPKVLERSSNGMMPTLPTQ